MNRIAKLLALAAVASAILVQTGASSAQAFQFHCSVEPCRYTLKADGEGTTGHQQLIIENKSLSESVSFTCSGISGEAVSAKKNAVALTFENVQYSGCTFNGSGGASVSMNGCDYRFSESGAMSVVGCEGGKEIEIKSGTGCTMTIGNQGPLTGITYHNVGEEAKTTTEITVETNVKGLSVIAAGNKTLCKIAVEQELIGTYTTGNQLLTGESEAAVMANAWRDNFKEFYCDVEPCRFTLNPDGSVGSSAAHHVITIKNGGASGTLTCNRLSGEATAASKVSTDLELVNLEYSGSCSLLGKEAVVRMNGCTYLASFDGTLTINCPEGEEMELINATCIAKIPPQGPMNGLTYGNAGGETEITMGIAVKGLSGELIGTKAGCGGIEPGAFTEGEYSTGNTLLTAETDKPGGTANAWTGSEEFHCSVEPCVYTLKNDGTGKTGHTVFIVENKSQSESGSFTCPEVSAEAASPKKDAAQLTLENVLYSNCTFNGNPGASVVMNGCDYKLSASGSVSIVGCPVGKAMEVINPSGCTITVSEQFPPWSGITYHNIGEEAKNTTEVTFSTSISGVQVTVKGGTKTSCGFNPAQELIGTFTTGNQVLKGEPEQPAMVGAQVK